MSESLTLTELCEALQVDEKRIRAWRKEGLPSTSKGRQLQFDAKAVSQWLLENGKATLQEEPEAIATTAAEAARLLGISYDRFNKWVTEPGFPGKVGKPGCREAWFPIRQIDEWRLGRFGSGDGGGKTDSRINQLRELKLELETQRQQLAFKKDLGQVLDLGDAQRFFEFSVATAKSVLDELVDRVDSRLPSKLSPKIRRRIRSVINRSLRDAYSAIEQVLSKDDDPTSEQDDSEGNASE